jgi:hypothetical protein
MRSTVAVGRTFRRWVPFVENGLQISRHQLSRQENPDVHDLDGNRYNPARRSHLLRFCKESWTPSVPTPSWPSIIRGPSSAPVTCRLHLKRHCMAHCRLKEIARTVPSSRPLGSRNRGSMMSSEIQPRAAVPSSRGAIETAPRARNEVPTDPASRSALTRQFPSPNPQFWHTVIVDNPALAAAATSAIGVTTGPTGVNAARMPTAPRPLILGRYEFVRDSTPREFQQYRRIRL